MFLDRSSLVLTRGRKRSCATSRSAPRDLSGSCGRQAAAASSSRPPQGRQRARPAPPLVCPPFSLWLPLSTPLSLPFAALGGPPRRCAPRGRTGSAPGPPCPCPGRRPRPPCPPAPGPPRPRRPHSLKGPRTRRRPPPPGPPRPPPRRGRRAAAWRGGPQASQGTGGGRPRSLAGCWATTPTACPRRCRGGSAAAWRPSFSPRRRARPWSCPRSGRQGRRTGGSL